MRWEVQGYNNVTTLDVFEASPQNGGVRIVRKYDETLEPVEPKVAARDCLTGFPSKNHAIAFAGLCQKGQQHFRIPLGSGEGWEIAEVWYHPARGFTADIFQEGTIFDTFEAAMDYLADQGDE